MMQQLAFVAVMFFDISFGVSWPLDLHTKDCQEQELSGFGLSSSKALEQPVLIN